MTAAELLAELWQPWGTPDFVEPTCRLTHQDISGQLGFPTNEPTKEPPRLTQVFETISATAETSVGNTDISTDQYNICTATNTFLQFSSATPVFGRVGVDSITAGSTVCILKEDTRTDDGTLRTIKRTYISAGQLSQVDTTKQNGNLLIRVVKSVYTVPATPSGFVLVSTDVQFVSGVKVYEYTFVQGTGEITHTFTKSQGGTETLNFSSPTPTTGAVVETIKYLTASSVTSDPTTSLLTGSKRISCATDDQDGYRIWTVSYAVGLGVVELENEYNEGGTLVIYRKIGLGSVPSAPSSTIGGTVTQIAAKSTNADGYIVYDYKWAEGEGEVSRSYEQTLGGSAGFDPTNLTAFTGIITETVKYLTAQSVTTNPTTSALASPALISIQPELRDGYKLWTVIYALGKGTIDLGVTQRYGGSLVMYHRIGLNTAPTTPTATIGGTVTLTESTVKNGTRFENGSTVYDYQWAEANGEIARRFTNAQGGPTNFDPANPTSSKGPVRCTIKFVTALSTTTDPTTPPGSFIRVAIDHEDFDGFREWTVTFGYGAGLVVDDKSIRENGVLYLYHRIALGSAPSAPSASISGTVTATAQNVRQEDGYAIYDYTWAEGNGIASESIQMHEDGTRTVARNILAATSGTSISSYIPTGILLRQDYHQEDGYTRFMIEVMQSATGGDPTSGTAISYEAWVPFRYPGQAKIFSQGLTTAGLVQTCIDVYKSPPLEALVKATHTVTYSTSNAVGALANPLWNPQQWATLRAIFASGITGFARSVVEGLPGYTAINGTVAGAGTTYTSILGEYISSAWNYSLSLNGGPTMPSGTSTFTLHAEVQPAFISNAGVQYYRRIVIEATPAALPALPV